MICKITSSETLHTHYSHVTNIFIYLLVSGKAITQTEPRNDWFIEHLHRFVAWKVFFFMNEIYTFQGDMCSVGNHCLHGNKNKEIKFSSFDLCYWCYLDESHIVTRIMKFNINNVIKTLRENRVNELRTWLVQTYRSAYVIDTHTRTQKQVEFWT